MLVSLLVGKRLRWMAMGAVVSYATKAKTQRDIDRATEALAERLPDPVQRVAEAMPGHMTRLGGSAIVAKNNAATAAKATVAVTRAARSAVGSANSTQRHLADRIRSARSELSDGIEMERRRLKSDAVRASEGEGAALEALLDLRAVDVEPLPVVKPPIDRGRLRHRPSLPPPQVARVQRSYLPPSNAWDRPQRKRSTDR